MPTVSTTKFQSRVGSRYGRAGILCKSKLLPNNLFICCFGSRVRGPSFATEEFMGKLVLGAAALALSAGAASAQTVYPGYDGYTATAPLYDYAGPASSAPVPATPHEYGPLIYAPQLFAPTPAFPAPPAEPGYYTAQSVVIPQPFYDYAHGYWGR